MHKIGQSGGFLDRPLGLLLKPSAKSVLIRLVLTAAASTTDLSIHKEIFGSGQTTLTISNKKINDVTKIVKSLEESGLLIEEVSQTIRK